MAKAVATRGLITVHEVSDLDDKKMIPSIMSKLYGFVDEYRKRPDRLSSFIITFDTQMNFEEYENFFWNVLHNIDEKDKKQYDFDPRVSSDPLSPEFSFSMKSEAFFILALHPESPRLARRFKVPSIVFNPHQQFENLRKNGVYSKVRDVIRFRDKMLQGFINPMLKDFGEKSEIFQYLGKTYSDTAQVPY